MAAAELEEPEIAGEDKTKPNRIYHFLKFILSRSSFLRFAKEFATDASNIATSI